MRSLLNANIRGNMNLTISCEAQASLQVKQYVDQVEWPFGSYDVIHQKNQLGVDGHNIACMRMIEKLGSALILEDDLVLSPYFQDYLLACSDIVKRERKLSGVSLYRYPMVEHDHFPFQLIPNDEFVYYQQRSSSKGAFYTWDMIKGYLDFYANFDNDYTKYSLPANVKKWSNEVWEKSFYCYLLQKDKYIAFPRFSFVTDSGDDGVHMRKDTDKYAHQSQLYLSNKIGSVSIWEETDNVYDSYYELLPSRYKRMVVELKDYEFEVDTYGHKFLESIRAPLLLSSKTCKKKIMGWERRLKPEVNNILLGQKGEFYSFGSTKDFIPSASIERLKSKFLYYYPDTRLLDLIRMKASEVLSRFIKT